MSVTLIVAILFTVGALLSPLRRTSAYWWLLTLALAAGAAINWLRWAEVIR